MLTEISGIPVEIVRKRMKNLRLAVLPPDGAVRVSAPFSVSEQDIRRFVQAKAGWIRRHRERFASRPPETPARFVSGEVLYLWGKQYRLEVAQGQGGDALRLSGDTAVLTLGGERTARQRADFVKEWYRALLKSEIERLLPLWEKRTGLYCTEWRVKDMSTRWGSCNTAAGRVWLNLQLAKKQAEG